MAFANDGKYLSAKQYEEIRELLEKGISVSKIAKLYGRDTSTIYKTARRNGWQLNGGITQNSQPEDMIEKLYQEGIGIDEISKILAIGKHDVLHHLSLLGISVLRESVGCLTQEEKEKILKMSAAGIPIWEIAKELGKGVLTIAKYFFEEKPLKQLPSKEKLEKKYGPLIGLSVAAREYMKMDHKSIYRAIDQGFLEGMYLTVGLDVRRETSLQRSQVKLLFRKDQLEEFQFRYKPLKYFTDEERAGIPLPTVNGYSSKGYLSEARLNHVLYDVKRVQSLLPYIRKEVYDHAGKKISQNQTMDYYELLNEEQRDWIDRYIQHRSSKMPAIIINFGMTTSYKTGFSKPQKQGPRVRKDLSRFFFLMICNRSGAQVKRLKEGNGAHVFATPTDRQRFDPDRFSIMEFESSDVASLDEDISLVTLHSYVNDTLKPFFHYVQMEMEKQFDKEAVINRWDPVQSAIESHRIQSICRRFHLAINQVTEPKDRYGDMDDARKVFLTREQFVLCLKQFNQSHGLEKSLMFAICTLLGLRREELTLVAVEDFDIDENGFLVTDKNGVGKLYLPNPKSKLGISGSKTSGTLIPPRLVRLINFYLQTLYKKCPFQSHREFEGTTFSTAHEKHVYYKGHGYLFRPRKEYPNSCYSVNSIGLWLHRMDKNAQLYFLPPEVRPYLSFHDGRHTLNEWIETARVSPDLMDSRDEAADQQMRHKGTYYKDVGKIHYRKRITQDLSYRCIIQALDFPWELKKLRKWEIMRGYRDPDDTEVRMNQKLTTTISTEGLIIESKERQAKRDSFINNVDVQLETAWKELHQLKHAKLPKDPGGSSFFEDLSNQINEVKERITQLEEYKKYQ
ncbi:helix-turn-helix domain-containing protein [Brevibacillus nitrificans]|uniref:helix-turn-helix domain-containing protein n=1 Tax=Brevibacillus nitrificans TaxID=651560 RepID=UPI00285EE960|nr:helix-turn-helix domain-containing protein [Brevibacillus nitrificans]MDR7315331.1 integrase [Brevibacillus nitrificans]